jgi:hypothetical protein
MRTCRFAFFAVLVFTLAAWPVSAQDSNAVSVTPYVAVGTAQAAPVGVAITFPLTSIFSLETDVAYRRGEGGIHALSSSASLLCALPDVGAAKPYLAAGIGLSQYGAPIFSSSGPPIGTEKSLALTMNAGGGLIMPMNDTLGMRTDARWFKSFGRQGSEQFRVAQGISFDVGKR